MLNLHLTAITSVASTGALGVTVWLLTKTGKLVSFIETHVEKAKTAWSKIDAIFEHLKANQPVVEAVQGVEQAAATDNTDLRDAKIKAALQLIPQALSVEVSNLSSIPAPMIVKYLTDRLPEYKDFLTPVTVTTALQTIKGEVQAARAHDGVKMMQEILTYMEQAAPATAESPATRPETSGGTDQPVQNHPEATKQPTTVSAV